MILNNARLASSLMVLSWMAAPAFAQTSSPAEEAPSAASSTPAAVPEQGTGEIVVTAQRRSERLSDVPLTIVAKTGEDLVRAGVQSTRDLQLVVPGLTFTTQGAWAEPSIRGVTTGISHAGADSPIAIYVDGVYQPNQIANVFDLPDVSQVEVLKGPQGTLFGRNATGGAILIHTQEPGNDFTGRLTLSDGVYTGGSANTANEFSAKGFVNVPIVQDFASLSVAGYYSHNDGYLTNDINGKSYGEIDSKMVRAKLLLRPADGVKLTFAGFYSKRKDDVGSSLFPLGGITNAALYPDAVIPTEPWHTAGEMGGGSHITAETWSASLKAEFDVAEAGSLTSVTSYTDSDVLVLVDADAAYSPTCVAAFACVTPYGVPYPNKTFQQELTFASEKFGAFSFVTGLFVYNDRHKIGQRINTPVNPDGSLDIEDPATAIYSNATVTTDAYAGFGEVYFDLNDSIRLIGGIRYSWEQKKGVSQASFGAPVLPFPIGTQQWDSWTPRASILVKATDDLNFYATYSKGFKSGVLDSTAPGNPPANPEYLTAYEAGLKYTTYGATLNASFFYYDYKDLQIQFFDGISSLLSNAAKAEVYGLDVDGTVRLGGLQLRLGASWLPKAEYTSYQGGSAFALNPDGTLAQVSLDASGHRLLKTPELTGNFSATYETDLNGGTLGLNGSVYYSGAYSWDLLDRIRTKEYAMVGAQIYYTPENLPVKFTLWGRNLTNQAFIAGAVPSVFADSVLYGAPRQIGISAEVNF